MIKGKCLSGVDTAVKDDAAGPVDAVVSLTHVRWSGGEHRYAFIGGELADSLKRAAEIGVGQGDTVGYGVGERGRWRWRSCRSQTGSRRCSRTLWSSWDRPTEVRRPWRCMPRAQS